MATSADYGRRLKVRVSWISILRSYELFPSRQQAEVSDSLISTLFSFYGVINVPLYHILLMCCFFKSPEQDLFNNVSIHSIASYSQYSCKYKAEVDT